MRIELTSRLVGSSGSDEPSFPRLSSTHKLATTAGATEVDPFTDARATRDLTPAWDKRQPYSEEKTTRLLGAADARILTLLLCGHAGLRISETLALEWADVDLSACVLVVRNGRGVKTPRVNLSRSLVAALEALG